MDAGVLIDDGRWRELLETRATAPDRVADAFAARRRRPLLRDGAPRIFLLGLDGPGDANGATRRRDLLERALTALAQPGVDGVIAAADVMEDLLLLGGLEDRIAIGAMNGAGAVGGLDDALTAYDARSIAESGLDGGRLRLRMAADGEPTAPALAAGARALTTLAARRIVAMIEPALAPRDDAGRPDTPVDGDALMRAARAASSLGVTSAYTWLLFPDAGDATRVIDATSLPVLLRQGDVSRRDGAGGITVAHPQVRGIVAAASLLYPADGDVAGAARSAAGVVHD